MAYFCILGWKKKIGATYDQAIYKGQKLNKKMCCRNPPKNALPGLKAEAMPKKMAG